MKVRRKARHSELNPGRSALIACCRPNLKKYGHFWPVHCSYLNSTLNADVDCLCTQTSIPVYFLSPTSHVSKFGGNWGRLSILIKYSSQQFTADRYFGIFSSKYCSSHRCPHLFSLWPTGSGVHFATLPGELHGDWLHCLQTGWRPSWRGRSRCPRSCSSGPGVRSW